MRLCPYCHSPLSDADVDQLQAENDRLRELVRELYEDQCDECDEWKYRDRMRELGVEVDA